MALTFLLGAATVAGFLGRYGWVFDMASHTWVAGTFRRGSTRVWW